jgi:hypothetical protein
VARTDVVRQIAPARTDTWNFGNTKGVSLIPWANTELSVRPPPYIQHNSGAQDGFGDMSFLAKYRIATGNAQHGSYTLTAFVLATLPTGKPATTTAGRPIVWNTVAQYRIGKHFWPEIESNATFYKGGSNDGKIQKFITPGLMAGRFALHPGDLKSRTGLTVGAGMQIAASHFHTYNHALILTARWNFQSFSASQTQPASAQYLRRIDWEPGDRSRE